VGMTRDDINKMTPEIEQYCTDFWDSHHIQPTTSFTRPITNTAMVTFPSSVGGPNWGPLSYNPQLGLAFINLHNTGSYRSGQPFFGGRRGGGGGGGQVGQAGQVAPAGPGGQAGQPGPPGPPGQPGQTGRAAGDVGAAGGPNAFSYRLPSGAMVPCYAPPYGALVAIDVNKGEIAWSVPLGLNESLAELGEIGLKTGIKNIGGSIATATGLVFIGATADHRFRAFDAKTGKELWVADLPAGGHATPITYMGKDGSQYVVIAASGGGPASNGGPISDALVAFKLAS
jgi:outer membrane protein assembly factor BamB